MKNLIFAVLVAASFSTVGCKSLKNDFLDPAKNNPNSIENQHPAQGPFVSSLFGNATGPSTQTLTTTFPPVNVSFYFSQDYGQPNFHCYPLGNSDTALPTVNPGHGLPWVAYTTTANSVTATFQGMDPLQKYCYEIKADPKIDASASHELY